MAMMEAIRDIAGGRKLTDDVILPLLRIISANTGVAFIEPAVLMSFEFGVLPNLSRSSRAILIIHLGMVEEVGHWVLATFQHGIVSVYDSMNSMVIGNQLKVTLERVFGKDKHIRTVPVATPQANENDCGVLACAYAVDWALGNNPGTIEYEYASLRPHLLTLLRDGSFVPFPRLLQVRVQAARQQFAQLAVCTPQTEQQPIQYGSWTTIVRKKKIPQLSERTPPTEKVLESAVEDSIVRKDKPTQVSVRTATTKKVRVRAPQTEIQHDVTESAVDNSIVRKKKAAQVPVGTAPTKKVRVCTQQTETHHDATEAAVDSSIVRNVHRNQDPVALSNVALASREQEIVGESIAALHDESGGSDSHDNLASLKDRVVGLLRNKYKMRVEIHMPYMSSVNKVKKNESFLGLCHTHQKKTDYYSVIAFIPEISSETRVYDFCGRKKVKLLSRKEKGFRVYFGYKVNLKINSAPCSASKSDPTKSCLLALLTMLYLARKMDPSQHIPYNADVVFLEEKLLAVIDDRLEPDFLGESIAVLDNESGGNDSDDNLAHLKDRVLSLLRKTYEIRVETHVLHIDSANRVNRNQRFLGLCHTQYQKKDYYSVMASLPEISSETRLYDFCGRNHIGLLTSIENSFKGYFSYKVSLKIKSAPCSISRRDPTRSCLLALLTMLYLARKMDPLQHIQYDANVEFLEESLLALINDCEQEHQSEQPTVSTEPQESNQGAAQQPNQQHGEDSEDVFVLKVRVMERIEEIRHTPVIEHPTFPESFTGGEFFGLIRIVNPQSGNDYYSALHCPIGGDVVIIHDFCGRTYSRDILELEKKFAATAMRRPGVRCKLMRYPTVATKKDTTKCLLYSLLTLLCVSQQKNVFDIVDSRSDVAALRLQLCRLLRGEQCNVPETRPVRPLYQRRRGSADVSTDLGNMDIRCYCCGALYFSCEVTETSVPQTKCCKEGRIATPRRRDTPEVLRRLMMEQTVEGKQFRASIYRYNSALAFASIHSRCPSLGQGAQAFIVQGQMYTTMYPGMAGSGSTPKGNQMYFLDIEEGVATRVEGFSGLSAAVVRELLEMLHACNPYAGIYACMRDYVDARAGQVPNVNLAMRADLNAAHRGTGAMPTSDEVVAVYTPSEDGDFGSMAVYSLTGDVPKKVQLNSPIAEPLLFPLLNPRGESGYERTPDARFTLREYCMYMLARRDEFSTFKYGGRLKQAYLCFQCLKIEDDRLAYISNNQGNLRVEMYKGLHDWVHRRAEEAHARVGRIVVLPATFTGGPRYMHRKYLDSLAAVCHFGRYDVFITITTNPRWPEITANIPPGQTVADNCDLVNRVFHAKLLKFIELIEKQQILGDVAAWLYVIEFQKRGLPHAHFVLIFTPQYSADNAARVEELVTAEIPEEEGIDRQLVLEFMLHEPCRSKPSAKCRRGPRNECRHEFPKEFSSRTHYGGSDERTVYMRRPSKKPGLLNGQIVDNDYVVPTNLKLLRALQCHVNVEVYQPLLGVKYLFKYLQKGEKRDTIQIQYNVAGEPGVAVSDEVRQFQTHRYLSCYEADWRLRASLITDCSHAIVRLPVHLPSEQMVYFVEGEEQDALRSAEERHSQLQAWFQLNLTEPSARSLKYLEIPTHYVWNSTHRRWQRRKKRGERTIVRMYDVPPSMGELFYLRLLLLHRTGATSYEDLRTVSGTVHDTFREACQSLGILEDDAEYVRCMTDAVSVKSAASLRRLFVQIVCFGAPADPHSLYNMFSKDMSDDYEGDDELQRKRHLDVRLRASLERLGYNFVSTGMDFLLVDTETAADLLEVREASNQSPPCEDRTRDLEQTFNEGQRAAYQAIIAAVEGGRNSLQSRVFFLDGAAGTGKTHLLNALIEIVESRFHRGLVFAMAWSGLAASLLRNGSTVHSTLKLPFGMDDATKVGLSFQSARTMLLRDSPLIIWDEISMSHVKAFTAFDSWLRLLMGNDKPFGDKVVVFAGDFRQILPVVRAADPETVVRVIVKNSVVWRSVQCLKLSESMRVTSEERDFSEFLLAVGEGSVPVPHGIPSGSIVIPDNALCSKQDLVSFVLDHRVSVHDAIILSVRNSDVDDMNALVARFSHGERKTYLSSDCNAYGDNREVSAHVDPRYRHNLPTEYLNRMNPPSMPPHRLTLRVGQPVMLLRNLDVSAGLCNGKRLIVTELRDDLVVCSRTDSAEPVLLCRHRFSTVETRDAVPFVRLQYPIKLAYACTVHKSQGQTFAKVGLYLRHSVFTHGMLYVAMSRVRRSCDLKICIEPGDSQGTREGVTYTKNVVFRDALQ